ncbi:MAG: class I SAM-dependent methyltransferase [Acidobacteriota bacterium]
MQSTERFSNRVDDYLKYRPHYPQGVIEVLKEHCGLSPSHCVADVGCGTGFLAELFLKNGNRVYGVEPNREMREAGRRYLANHPAFECVEGTAEKTTLPAGCVDFATAGQAFHWFRRGEARREFLRILRPEGWAVLVWNDRSIGGSLFLEAYENLLLRHGTDYRKVDHKALGKERIEAFFGPRGCRVEMLQNRQVMDFTGLRGRLLSSSYVPSEDDPRSRPMLDELALIFEEHQQEGRVSIEYQTRVVLGQLQ